MEIILPLLAAIGGGALTALVTAWANRRKTHAEAMKIVTDAARELLGDYRAQTNELQEQERRQRKLTRELESRIREMQDELTEHERAIGRLSVQVTKLNMALIINQTWADRRDISLPVRAENIAAMSVDELRRTALDDDDK